MTACPPRPVFDLANPADREHRRRHHRSVPGNIERDPELQAWVDAHILDFTFAGLATLVRGAFGPERAPSRSTLHRYFKRHEARLLAAATPNGPSLAPGGSVHGRRKCLWCNGALPKPAAQQAQQRFCAARCRTAFHSAARRWAVAAVIDGRLTVAELRRHAQKEEIT